MALRMDPEVAAAMAPLAAAMARVTPPPVGDWRARRAATDKSIGRMTAALARPTDVTATDHVTERDDGTALGMRLYRKAGSSPGSLAVHLHGGGMICCSVATHDPMCRRYTAGSGVPLLAPEYRYAPEHPYPASVEDAYAALRWASRHAAELGVDPRRIAVMGDSAGGGIAAALALMARDRGGPPVARQILLYPMLDDRTLAPDPHVEPPVMWSAEDNATAWHCLLGDAAGGPGTPAYAAPNRATDLSGLPPAYLDVGQLDLFRSEAAGYADRLGRAGVDVEFHLHTGVPHAFDLLAPDSAVARRAHADRLRVLRSV